MTARQQALIEAAEAECKWYSLLVAGYCKVLDQLERGELHAAGLDAGIDVLHRSYVESRSRLRARQAQPAAKLSPRHRFTVHHGGARSGAGVIPPLSEGGTDG